MISSSRFHLCVFLFTTSVLSSHATDTIDTSQILTDSHDDTIISSAGAFALGFFSPGSSKNRYVGIRYNKIKQKSVVWVANKDDPLTDRSGALSIARPGHLLLLNATNATIWSTNSSTSAGTRNPIAQLLDSGNLVVRDANDENPDNYIWQSFDYPTDTFLPGMKLGTNLVTGHEVYISSSKNNDDPSPGDFTYHCDPSGYPQLVIKRGDAVQFKTGPWNGVSFSGSHNLVKNDIFSFGVVIDKDEVYYHYELVNGSVYTRFTMSEGGVGQRWLWSYQTENWILYLTIPTDNCDIYGMCGAYGSCDITSAPACACLSRFEPKDARGWGSGDWSNGCVRRVTLDCRKGDVFLKYPGVKLPDTEHSWYNESMSLEECKVLCSRNCSCTAYASLDISRGGGNGCLLWFGDLVDMRQISPGQDVYIRMAKSELGSGSWKREILIATLSVVMGVLLLGLALLVFFQKRKKHDHEQQESERQRHNYVDNYPNQSHEELELPVFELSTIIEATDDFSIDNKLGEGGFGPVYKGLLGEGQEIAVKRLSKTSFQGEDEFKNEVICIAKLQHRNLVKLLGCCIQGEEKILVYEYMTNNSLDLILFDQVKRMILDWPRRFNIINGIARGLMYLHHDSRLRVIHRDLKASNILLDSDMNPKISDFGLARIVAGNETGDNTSRVVGTYGYMSPEYAVNGMFSVKSDVFSFGVLVLETISGKKNRGFSQGDHNHNLLGYAWMLHREERSVELVDSCLGYSSCHLSQVVRSIHVGLLCVQERPEDRPNMSSVVVMLNNDGALPKPKHPAFFTGRDMITETWRSSNIASSANAITMSMLQAR